MSGPTQQQGIPVAPGYPNYTNTFLIPPVQSDRMLERFYCDSIYTQITSKDALNEITGPGGTVYFLKEPCLAIRPFVKDGVMQYDTFEADTCSFTIGTAKYFGIKIADHDKMMIKNWSRYLQAMTDAASRLFSQQLDCEIMACVISEVDCNNKGSRAGVVTHAYDLGTPGQPRIIDKDSIIDFLADLESVMDEQCLPESGRFLVVPTRFKNIMLKSELRNACAMNCGSGVSPMATGEPPSDLFKFSIIYSNCVPSVQDAVVNDRCWYVIGGLPMATAFASWAKMSAEMRDKDNPYETYISTVMSYGYAVMYPQALVLGYIRFA
jgi:hypothetical protein